MENSVYGLLSGMTMEEVKRNTISLNPQPDPYGEWFTFYPETPDFPYKYFSCKITKKYGLTRICAWTQNIKTNRNGAELFSLFEHLRDQESQIYGPDHYLHTLKNSAVYKEPEQLTLSLLYSERIICSFFARDFGSRLPEKCQLIQLTPHVRDEFNGNIHKRYVFDHDTD